ncbi:MAG: type II toxin-antitoxin system YoeB family toxin [Pseudomonadota bacterium]
MKLKSRFNKKIHTYCVLSLLLGVAALKDGVFAGEAIETECRGYVNNIKLVQAEFSVRIKSAEKSVESAQEKVELARSKAECSKAERELIKSEKALNVIIDKFHAETAVPRYKLAHWIAEGAIHHDERGIRIYGDRLDETVARLLRESISCPEAKNKLALLISEEKTDLDEKGNDIDLYETDADGNKSITPRPEYRNEIVARLYRESKTLPMNLYNIATLIRGGKTNFDENGGTISTPEQRCAAEARLYRNSKGVPQSLCNLAFMIREGKTNFDENGASIITLAQRDEVVARLYRKSKREPQSLLNLAIIIDEGKTNFDENEAPITTPAQRHEVIARLYRNSKEIPESLRNLADMIYNGQTDLDENGATISTPEQRCAAEAKLYRNSKEVPESLCNLAVRIHQEKTNLDENGATIRTQEQRYETVARLCRNSKEVPESLRNLAHMILDKTTNLDENGSILNNNSEKLVAIERILQKVATSEKNYIKALAYRKYGGDTMENLREIKTNLERALAEGCSAALPVYSSMEEQFKSLEPSEPSAELTVSELSAGGEAIAGYMSLAASGAEETKEDDVSDDYTSDEDDEESQLDTKASSSSEIISQELTFASSTLSPEEFHVEQRARAINWKETAKRQRQTAQAHWQEKVENARNCVFDLKMNVYASKVPTLKEHWEKAAIQGRLRLAELGRAECVELLIGDINIDGRLGRPETLSGDYTEWMSRRITKKHRLVYRVAVIDGQRTVLIKECGGHYSGK